MLKCAFHFIPSTSPPPSLDSSLTVKISGFGAPENYTMATTYSLPAEEVDNWKWLPLELLHYVDSLEAEYFSECTDVVCICMHTHSHTHTHTHTHTHVHTHVHTHTHMHIHTYSTCSHAHAHTYTHTYTHTCTHTHTHAHTHLQYMLTWTHAFIHTLCITSLSVLYLYQYLQHGHL